MAIAHPILDLETATNEALTQEYMRVIEQLNDLYDQSTVFRDDQAILAEESRLQARAYDLHLQMQRRQRLRVTYPEGAHV